MDLIEATIKTMSSREIAELTEKRHDNVLADARKMLVELHGEGGILSFQDTQVNPQNGQEYPVLRLPKRETLILVSGYSVTMRARIIDRWQELEEAQAIKVPTTLSGALRLAAEQAEKIEAQALMIENQRPAVEFVERYTVADHGAKGFREVCKLLGANEARFKEFLTASKIMYRLGKSLTAYQNHIDANRFEVKAGEANGHAYNRCLFTPKGVAWVAGEWAKFSLPRQS
jgi:phage antirepressor YoqD-like protein